MRELETEVKIIEPILGKTIESVSVSDDKEELFFIFTDHSMTRFYHELECSEFVSIESIDGDLDNLIGEPLLQAEETTQEGDFDEEKWHLGSYTWTFYKFATNKGYVTIRWYGESNGWYGERVNIKYYPCSTGGVFRYYLERYLWRNLYSAFNSKNTPVFVYIKEDGYKVLFYYDAVNDSLEAISFANDYNSDYYVTFLKGVIGEKGIERLKMYCKGENASVIYELIDPINDPHIIEYPEHTALMLDIIDNTIEIKLRPFSEVYALSCYIGSPCNDPVYVFNNKDSFEKILSEIKREGHMFNGGYVAGYVFEDAKGNRYTQETGYYRLWKHLMHVMGRALDNKDYVICLYKGIDRDFFDFVKENAEDFKLLECKHDNLSDTQKLQIYRKLFLEQLEKESK